MDKLDAWKRLKFDIMFVGMIGIIQKMEPIETSFKEISK